LKAEETEKFWDDTTVPNGEQFFDYVHKESGARILKAQHPDSSSGARLSSPAVEWPVLTASGIIWLAGSLQVVAMNVSCAGARIRPIHPSPT